MAEPAQTDAPDTDPAVVGPRDAAWTHYRHERAMAGADLALQAIATVGDHGELWFVHACCLERAGRLHAADHAFCRARRAQRFPVGLPCRVGWPRFRRSVDRAIDALPPRLRAALAEVSLILADYAEPVLLQGFEEPELFGLFTGETRADRAYGAISPRVYVWRRAHEHAVATLREFDAEVKQTLWHELGHYLGYDEDELDDLGRG
jgi:predicted Zn-dependent protease with MMP-like domain